MNVKKDYQLAIDELNVIALKLDKSQNPVDDILTELIEAYLLGLHHASVMLNIGELPVDLVKMQNVIYQNIEGKTFAERAEDHILSGESGKLRTLAESEFHRVYNNAVEDGVRETGYTNVTKTWVTLKDDRVRETHDYLEGMTVPVNEDFYTFDGDHAPYPGGFEKPENNVNCRCILQYQME